MDEGGFAPELEEVAGAHDHVAPSVEVLVLGLGPVGHTAAVAGDFVSSVFHVEQEHVGADTVGFLEGAPGLIAGFAGKGEHCGERGASILETWRHGYALVHKEFGDDGDPLGLFLEVAELVTQRQEDGLELAVATEGVVLEVDFELLLLNHRLPHSGFAVLLGEHQAFVLGGVSLGLEHHVIFFVALADRFNVEVGAFESELVHIERLERVLPELYRLARVKVHGGGVLRVGRSCVYERERRHRGAIPKRGFVVL